MKKQMFIIAVLAVCLTACEKVELAEPTSGNDATSEVPATSLNGKKFTFTIKGDFSEQWKADAPAASPAGQTRAYLQADGRDLTDVWILDYDASGTLLQQLHQSDNTATDFGKPVMTLAYGSHHVYFIASRGASPTLDTSAKTITFGTVRDTFWKDYEVTVVSTSNGNRAVTLDRIVTRLKLTFTDAIPATAATFNVTPTTWFYGLNYQTGAPCAPATSQTITCNIPSTSIGQTGEYMTVFGFSAATEWTTDVTVNAKTAGGDILGQATITAAPFLANRSTDYSGPLFGSPNSEVTMTLNSTWATAVTGTW